MNILSIDYGERRIGFAIGNSNRKIATPLSVIQNVSLDSVIENIIQVVKNYEIDSIIIGIPLNEDSTESMQATRVRDFCSKIKKKINLTIMGVDERFTSVNSEKLLLDLDMSRKKRKKYIDSIAATIILQSYFANNETILL
jgi:putative Holliday junction resolvase|tara:strand:- start:2396 stop:2818 length:423 start_codon:yes stop_codon:yes gene_type:complete